MLAFNASIRAAGGQPVAPKEGHHAAKPRTVAFPLGPSVPRVESTSKWLVDMDPDLNAPKVPLSKSMPTCLGLDWSQRENHISPGIHPKREVS